MINKRIVKNITFRRLDEQEYATFRNDVKQIFSIAIIEEFGELQEEGDIIPDEDINLSLYNPQCEVFFVYYNDEKVGGVAIKEDKDKQCNWLYLFYIYPEYHSKGIGLQIWQAIEKRYHETMIWKLITPYFEKRNIHFYVNKCGFKIIEFFNKHHQNHNGPSSSTDFNNEYFVFEKKMI